MPQSSLGRDPYRGWNNDNEEPDDTKPSFPDLIPLEEDDGWDSDSEHPDNIQPSSIHRPISQRNKGYEILIKMGWKKDEGLGIRQNGITVPIKIERRPVPTAGIGYSAGRG